MEFESLMGMPGSAFNEGVSSDVQACPDSGSNSSCNYCQFWKHFEDNTSHTRCAMAHQLYPRSIQEHHIQLPISKQTEMFAVNWKQLYKTLCHESWKLL